MTVPSASGVTCCQEMLPCLSCINTVALDWVPLLDCRMEKIATAAGVISSGWLLPMSVIVPESSAVLVLELASWQLSVVPLQTDQARG